MRNIKLTVAFLLLAIGIEELVRWFMITDQDIPFEAMKAEYAKALPGFLQNITLHTFLLMGCFIGAGLLFLSVRKDHGLNLFSKIAAILCFILAFWMLFTLM